MIIICFEYYGGRITKIEVESLDTEVPGYTLPPTPPIHCKFLKTVAETLTPPLKARVVSGDGDVPASALW